MKVKITGLPEMKMGGILADYPYAGQNRDVNPFGNITPEDTEINGSIKPVERDLANMEAEKGEKILKFDLGGLFDIKGKRHSAGGTPIKADAGDFIFSRDKDLAITKQEKEVFDFKDGGKYKKTENTPAKVLGREVNSKEYNSLINVLKDPKSDAIANTTANLMLEKYTEKIGQVAYLQEAKKGFPNGIPDFSMGTAPVKADDMADNEAISEQYRYGGLAQFKGGGRQRRNDNLQPSFAPPYVNAFTGPKSEVNAWGQNLRQFGYNGSLDDVNEIQQWVNTNAPESAPYIYRNGLFGLNNKNYDPNRSDFNDDYVRDQFNDGRYAEDMWTFQNKNYEDYPEYAKFMNSAQPVGKLNGSQYYFNNSRDTNNKPVFDIPSYNPTDLAPLSTRPTYMPVTPATTHTPTALPVPEMSPMGTPARERTRSRGQDAYDGSIPWNGQEKLTTALPFLQAFMRKDQYPMLQQIHTPEIELDRVSNAAELSVLNQQSSLGQRELYGNMNGRNASINAAAMRADLLNNTMRSNAQNNNINTQIANQEDMTNYQSMINDRNFNVQAVQQNYDQNNLVLGRRQEELANAFGQSINNGVQIQDKLDTLKQSFAQASMKTLDKNGQPRFILDPNTRTPVLNPNWKGNIMDNPFIGSTGNQVKYQELMLKALTDALNSSDVRAKTYAASTLQKMFRPDSKGNTSFNEFYGNY